MDDIIENLDQSKTIKSVKSNSVLDGIKLIVQIPINIMTGFIFLAILLLIIAIVGVAIFAIVGLIGSGLIMALVAIWVMLPFIIVYKLLINLFKPKPKYIEYKGN